MSSTVWLLAEQATSSGQNVATDKSRVRCCFLRRVWALSLCLNGFCWATTATMFCQRDLKCEGEREMNTKLLKDRQLVIKWLY